MAIIAVGKSTAGISCRDKPGSGASEWPVCGPAMWPMNASDDFRSDHGAAGNARGDELRRTRGAVLGTQRLHGVGPRIGSGSVSCSRRATSRAPMGARGYARRRGRAGRPPRRHRPGRHVPRSRDRPHRRPAARRDTARSGGGRHAAPSWGRSNGVAGLVARRRGEQAVHLAVIDLVVMFLDLETVPTAGLQLGATRRGPPAAGSTASPGSSRPARRPTLEGPFSRPRNGPFPPRGAPCVVAAGRNVPKFRGQGRWSPVQASPDGLRPPPSPSPVPLLRRPDPLRRRRRERAPRAGTWGRSGLPVGLRPDLPLHT